MITTSIIGMIQPLFIKRIIDNYTDSSLVMASILFYGLSIITILISEMGTKYFRQTYTAELKNKYRDRMIKSFLDNDYTDNSSDVVSSLNADINTNIDDLIRDYYLNRIDIMVFGLSIIFYIFTLVSIDPILAIIIVLPNVMTLLIPGLVQKRLTQLKKGALKSRQLFNLRFFDFFSGINILKNHFAILNFQKGVEETSENNIDSEFRLGMFQSWTDILIGTIAYGGIFVLVFYSGISLIRQTITVGTVIAAFQFNELIVIPIIRLTTSINTRTVGNTLKEKMDHDYPIREIIPVKDEILNFKECHANELTYITEDGKQIFQIPSLSIKRGDKVLIIGDNGTGKSTFLDLFMRKKKDYRGSFQINGIELSEINFAKMSQYITYLPQNNHVFQTSINNNITLGLRENIDSLWLNTIRIGEDYKLDRSNQMLSGGEKQQICFVRTMISGRDVVIIDEGLNEIQSDIRQNILKTLISIEDLTLLYVSHNPKDFSEGFTKHLNFTEFQS